MSLDSFGTKKTLEISGKKYTYYSLPEAAAKGLGNIDKLPRSLKVLLENLLRWEDGASVSKDHVQAIVDWQKTKSSKTEIAYHPARVLMQDFTGVPAVVDLAAMRDAMKNLGGDAEKINPLTAVDLVIDHSVSVEKYATPDAFEKNVEIEFKRNFERYEFLKWGQGAFKNFRVVPPGTGICHQVNLEYLAKVVWTSENADGELMAYPDTLVGTDSHTTMINGLSVLGWGVGGIEAEAAMLGQPVSMLIPEVIGFKLDGALPEGATATDLVLMVVQMLRARGVVGKFVEFYGSGLNQLTLADKATLSNMAPEYGATCGFFPIDQETLNYLHLSGREQETIDLVEHYAKAQGIWRDENSVDPEFSDSLHLDLSKVVPSIAGPKRPQDRIELKNAKSEYQNLLTSTIDNEGRGDSSKRVAVENSDFDLGHGDVVIAAITSCTNTSNPAVMLAAGLVAKKANALGLKIKPWVKPSLAPGSQVVTEYLVKSGLQTDLDDLGFNLVGYGCTTCIGNSGPLPENIVGAIQGNDLTVASVLSGNRNFEGRISPHVKTNYLASPPLVVIYALAGSMNVDVTTEAIATTADGKEVFLKDLWPTNAEIQSTLSSTINREMFQSRYADVFEGPTLWKDVPTTQSQTYPWSEQSTYIKNPPYFEGMTKESSTPQDVLEARPLAILGDSVTTDHISPAGVIQPKSPAGQYLAEKGIGVFDFNSFGSRRGNHEVMMRGTFGNVRLRNEMAPGTEGGFTKKMPEGTDTTIYEASMTYQKEGTPLVVFAGKEYGTGSSRDWAAKGTILLGVKAVVVESFERIHRSNLIGMGVLPLQFKDGENRKTLNLNSEDTYDITGVSGGVKPGQELSLKIHRVDGTSTETTLLCRIDTADEAEYYANGGILHYVLRNLAKS